MAADLEGRAQEAQDRFLSTVSPEIRSRRVKWSGGEIQVLDQGEGAPVVLVHGGLGDALQWGPIIPKLAENFHVYAIDRPGHGMADPFDYTGVDVGDHARTFLGESFDGLELQNASVVANSMGGLWAVAFARAHPERVSRLVLVGAPAGSKRRAPMQLRMLRWPVIGRLIQSTFGRATPEGTRRFWKQLLVARPERLSDELLEAVAACQRRNAASWSSFIPQILDWRGIRPELVVGRGWSELSMPVTFIWGEKDAFDDPTNGEKIARQVGPNARFIRISDAGHLPWFDDPVQVTVEIERALKAS